MMRPVNFIVTAALLFSLAGCGPASEKASHRKTYSEAEQTFIDYMQSEHKLTPVIRRVHNTVWIYQTMEGPLFDFEAQKRVKGTVREQKFKVHYVEGNFTDGTLALDYDISKTFQKKIDTGYGSQYNEEFTKMRMRVYDAVKEAFFDMNQIPGDRTFIDPLRQEKRDRMLEEYIPKVDTPEFFVIVIMNIEEGIGAKSIFYFEDYRRQAMGELPPEEYQLREINEVYGDVKAVKDVEGTHLTWEAVTMPWFLTEQVEKRVTFAFESSRRPPSDVESGILEAIQNTARYYGWASLKRAVLHDLREDVTASRPILVEETPNN